MRKTANLLIRQPSSKRTSKQQIPGIKSRTSVVDNTQKKWQTKQQNIQLQKEITKAENLTQQQIAKIHKQAQKTANKKTKVTQTKIQNDMVSFLELQCNKLGCQVQKKQSQNSKLKIQINQLRKNIDFLNRKLQAVYKDHQSLAKNNDYGQMQKNQMRQEIIKLKGALTRKQNQNDFIKKKYQSQIEKLTEANKDLTNKISFYESSLSQIKQQKEQIEEFLEQKTNQCQYLRENFEQRKKQWDRIRQGFQSNSKDTIQKKAEKIAKNQAQIQNLTDKLKQEQTLRKKALEKGKQLQKQISKKSQIITNFQDQISQLKKRVNDLSILKSSNNTILSQKIQKMQEENIKLKKQLQNCKKPAGYQSKQENSKPYLFGPTEDQQY